MKRCTKCHQLLPDSAFYVRRDNSSLQSQCKDCCKAHGRLRNGTTGIYKKEKDMEDFTFWDIPTHPSRHTRMKKDEVSINNKKENHSVTFNQEVSKEIIEAGFIRYRIRQDNITGEIHFVFVKDPAVGTKFNVTGKEKKNITCTNKIIVERLYNHFNLQSSIQRYIGKISRNLSNSDQYYTVRIDFRK